MIAWRWNICKEEVRFVDGEEDVSDNALVWCVAVCVCGLCSVEGVRKSKKMRRRRDDIDVD